MPHDEQFSPAKQTSFTVGNLLDNVPEFKDAFLNAIFKQRVLRPFTSLADVAKLYSSAWDAIRRLKLPASFNAILKLFLRPPVPLVAKGMLCCIIAASGCPAAVAYSI